MLTSWFNKSASCWELAAGRGAPLGSTAAASGAPLPAAMWPLLLRRGGVHPPLSSTAAARGVHPLCRQICCCCGAGHSLQKDCRSLSWEALLLRRGGCTPPASKTFLLQQGGGAPPPGRISPLLLLLRLMGTPRSQF